jgi:hypothetical protein
MKKTCPVCKHKMHKYISSGIPGDFYWECPNCKRQEHYTRTPNGEVGITISGPFTEEDIADFGEIDFQAIANIAKPRTER